jgi:diadenosine tetraphosphate (Ap4A) HIT family hydrolase
MGRYDHLFFTRATAEMPHLSLTCPGYMLGDIGHDHPFQQAAVSRLRYSERWMSPQGGSMPDTQPDAHHRDTDCVFCRRLAEGDIEAENDLCAIVLDQYPVNPGHRLVIPKRHVASYFSLTKEEKRSLWELVDEARDRVERGHHPDGYNIGLNDRAAAGQTIPHVHMHVMPRYQGDRDDPRGGVRWIIPERARYWDS